MVGRFSASEIADCGTSSDRNLWLCRPDRCHGARKREVLNAEVQPLDATRLRVSDGDFTLAERVPLVGRSHGCPNNPVAAAVECDKVRPIAPAAQQHARQAVRLYLEEVAAASSERDNDALAVWVLAFSPACQPTHR
jgi:hypothetical protein